MSTRTSRFITAADAVKSARLGDSYRRGTVHHLATLLISLNRLAIGKPGPADDFEWLVDAMSRGIVRSEIARLEGVLLRGILAE